MKFRKIGTNINSYLKRFEEDKKQGKKEYKYEEFSSATKFNNSIEVLLVFGLIEPQRTNYFNTKKEFQQEVFLFKDIECDLENLFLNNYHEKEIYKDMNFLKKSILVSSSIFDKDKNSIKDIVKEIKEPIDLDEIDYIKDFYVEELNTLSVNNLFKKEFLESRIPKYKEMNENYLKSVNINILEEEETKYKSEYNKPFSETYNVKDLIKKVNETHYEIPVYQRSYVWTKELIDNLLEDMKKGNSINLNNVTFKEKRENNLNIIKIIDGQQRITSLYLIYFALFRYLNSYFSEYEEGLIEDEKNILNKLLYIRSEVKVEKTFDKVNGSHEIEVFDKIVRYQSLKSVDYDTNTYKNYEHIYMFLENMSLIELNIFIETFLNKVYIFASFDKFSEEFLLFERLNTTSIKLSTIDLIKSYLISLIKDEDLLGKEEKIESKFEQEVVKPLNKSKSKRETENFIRVFLRLNHQSFKKSSLLEGYKKFINKESKSLSYYEVEKLIDDLSEVLTIYNFIKGRNELPESYRGLKVEDFVVTLGSRDIYQPMIIKLLLGFKQKIYTNNEIRELLFEIEKYEVVLKICFYRGQSLTLKIDNEYNKLFLGEEKVEKKQLENLLYRMDDNLKIPKLKFKEIFKEFTYTTEIAKIILMRITNYLYNNNKITLNEGDGIRVLSSLSVEHIMPQEGSIWIKEGIISKDEHSKNVNKIGNMLLLEKNLNAKYRNKLFSYKKNQIERECSHMDTDYTYHLNKERNGYDLYTKKKFDEKEIIKRTEYLANLACEIWR